MNMMRIICLKRIFTSRTTPSVRTIHKTAIVNGLEEFFDEEKNWGATEVKSGRSWRIEELRIKSNVDLHKLWYILLKERNMLLTMEEESIEQVRLFPNPERIDKVEESMENLEMVVKERNEAYHMLERGESGLQPTKTMPDNFGLPKQHIEQEYFIPKEQNSEWQREHKVYDDKDVRKFRCLLREKQAKEAKRKNTRDFNHVIGLVKRFPKLDLDAVKEQYPNVNINKVKSSSKSRGHSVPELYNKDCK